MTNTKQQLLESMLNLGYELEFPTNDERIDHRYYMLCQVIKDVYSYAYQHNIKILDIDLV
jgi:hypothetical protein